MLGNQKKKNDMPQTGAFHMADEEKLPFPHAGAGRAGKNGGGGKSVFSRKKGAVLFRAGNVLGMAGVMGKFASGCAVIIKALEQCPVRIEKNETV